MKQVLSVVQASDGGAILGGTDEGIVIVLSVENYDSLGKPDKVTVTVEAGEVVEEEKPAEEAPEGE